MPIPVMKGGTSYLVNYSSGEEYNKYPRSYQPTLFVRSEFGAEWGFSNRAGYLAVPVPEIDLTGSCSFFWQ